MNICVLISCMHQSDHSIVERTGVQTDCVVVNQCDTNREEDYTFVNKKGETCHVRFISTTERGLSRSRNKAIANAPEAAVCLVCDDDETLAEGYADLISKAYEQLPEADVITFKLDREGTKKVYPTEPKGLSFVNILKTGSWEITFKKSKISSHSILFDEQMGSGTGNGGGEENKFLLDCRRNKLCMQFYPATIGTLHISDSQWFKGYTPKYFSDHGWSSRRLLGAPVGLLYAIYYVVKHHSLYSKELSFLKALRYELKGWAEKR